MTGNLLLLLIASKITTDVVAVVVPADVDDVVFVVVDVLHHRLKE